MSKKPDPEPKPIRTRVCSLCFGKWGPDDGDPEVYRPCSVCGGSGVVVDR